MQPRGQGGQPLLNNGSCPQPFQRKEKRAENTAVPPKLDLALIPPMTPHPPKITSGLRACTPPPPKKKSRFALVLVILLLIDQLLTHYIHKQILLKTPKNIPRFARISAINWSKLQMYNMHTHKAKWLNVVLTKHPIPCIIMCNEKNMDIFFSNFPPL